MYVAAWFWFAFWKRKWKGGRGGLEAALVC